jgi:hypothetical protein
MPLTEIDVTSPKLIYRNYWTARGRAPAAVRRGSLRRRPSLSASARRGPRGPMTGLEKTPGAVQARYGRFYASVEMEDFATAHAVIDSLVADQPVWRGYKDEPTRYPNPDRACAEVTAALLKAGRLTRGD